MASLTATHPWPTTAVRITSQGSPEQLVLGLIICFLFEMAYLFFLPFGSVADNALAIVSQFATFVTLLQAVSIKYDSGGELSDSVSIILLTALVVPVFLIVFFTAELALDECGYDMWSWFRKPAKDEDQEYAFISYKDLNEIRRRLTMPEIEPGQPAEGTASGTRTAPHEQRPNTQNTTR